MMAYRYADSAIMVKDSAFIRKSGLILARAQQKTDIEHHKLEVEQLEHQKNIQTLQRNSLFFIVVLLIIVSVLLINRQRLLKKQKLYAEAQQQQAVIELANAQQQLNTFITSIREKNELVERLTTEMHQLQNVLDKDAMDYRHQTVNQLRQATILTNDQWKDFRYAFEKAYRYYFTPLQEKLPGLSAADIRFMALSKLKFNAREMAASLGISPNSIRMSLHRLRKKYNLADEESLEVIVESI